MERVEANSGGRRDRSVVRWVGRPKYCSTRTHRSALTHPGVRCEEERRTAGLGLMGEMALEMSDGSEDDS